MELPGAEPQKFALKTMNHIYKDELRFKVCSDTFVRKYNTPYTKTVISREIIELLKSK
jgi:hypothetical protein